MNTRYALLGFQAGGPSRLPLAGWGFSVSGPAGPTYLSPAIQAGSPASAVVALAGVVIAGKAITKTHSTLPKACAQAVGRSAHKESDPRPPRNPRSPFLAVLLSAPIRGRLVAHPALSIPESILKWVAHPAFRWRGGDSRCQTRQGRHI